MKPVFANYLQQDSILFLEGENKKQIIEEIIASACTHCTMDEDQLRDAIWKREKMMTTGVGQGLALPHIRVNGFPCPLVIVGICKTPITDYKSADGQPIDVVIFLAADERDQQAYLELLGSISAKMKQPDTKARIQAAGEDRKAIINILSE